MNQILGFKNLNIHRSVPLMADCLNSNCWFISFNTNIYSNELRVAIKIKIKLAQ
jgi:hypothetical protein